MAWKTLTDRCFFSDKGRFVWTFPGVPSKDLWPHKGQGVFGTS
ncbi:hypothetical protein PspLS_09195 [Pyricularia sp. CBS 133598]|nr:hypothetical protein PspLS_09195 [Pyricularia sp. CBS 133598]